MEWQRIITAPFDRDLQLAVINARGVHSLVFLSSCSSRMDQDRDEDAGRCSPTHWREWNDTLTPSFSHRPAA